MTLEDRIWNDLVKRKRFCTARQISSRLQVPLATVRAFVTGWANRQILDVIIKDRTYYYRIKE